MIGLLLAIIYLAFISLGLPDSLLGAVWPSLYTQINVPLSYAGILQMLIAGCTVVSALQSDRLTKKMGTGLVTALSVLTTAVALFGYSTSTAFWQLVLWSIPYGLGAGSVDAALNNYVALHFKSRHMSWLHCMWGLGATAGPLLMSLALTNGGAWQGGYRYVFYIQIVLTIILFMSLPLWKRAPIENVDKIGDITSKRVLSIKEILRIPGAKSVMIMFFGYCALEQTTALWASSYLVLNEGLSPDKAARFAGLFFLGVTVGRAISGFITFKLSDNQMIKLGLGIISVGIIMILLPLNSDAAYIGLIIVGLGCAPIYPCIIHSTPANFGSDKSQAIIGVQMASAYIGSCLMPSFFGFLSKYVTISFFPIYLTILLVIIAVMHRKLMIQTGNRN
ncbi:MAG: MFS transporter [Sphaerochaetaceae bacterium]|nr:MFS transporter [Sphaerochaetaceae bacterium]